MKRLLIIGIVVAAAAGQGMASDLSKLDSSAFSYKYEMDALPTQEDLDGDGAYDFTTANGPTLSTSYGIATCSLNPNRYFISNTDSGAGSVWRKFAPASGEGYTIELRMKVTGQITTTAVALNASYGEYDALLNFKTNSLSWGSFEMSFNTTDAFHIYRIAKIPNENRFVLWCDGKLVADNLTDAMPSNTGLNRLILGAIGGAYGGTIDVSYLRFTKGAYAPARTSLKPLAADSSEFSHKYEMDSSDGRFEPRKDGTDWTHNVVGGGTVTLSDGILSVVQPSGAPRYYTTKSGLDSSVTASSPFTLEIKALVSDRWFENIDKVLFVSGGTPRANCSFFIGENSVQYGSSVLDTSDNTDRMHVFRIAYEGEGKNGVTMWRDGKKIGANLQCSSAANYARFGIASGTSHGGSFYVDYIRWTTAGVFVPPKSGMMIIVR